MRCCAVRHLRKKELQEREKLLEFLEQDEETRVRMQEIFFKIGRTGKYSLYDYMDFLDVLGERKNGKHLLVDLLVFSYDRSSFCQSTAWIVWCEHSDVF